MAETQSRILGYIAEFDTPGDLIHAAEELRDSEYSKFDCHSPFPIHGMDAAMGERRSVLGWIVALAALTGLIGAITMQWWMSAVDYKLIIAGKPFFSYQAFFPVTFSAAVLFSALATVFGMLFLVRPRFNHPVFTSDRFSKVTDDGFFVSILTDDPRFDENTTKEFLESIGGKNVEALKE